MAKSLSWDISEQTCEHLSGAGVFYIDTVDFPSELEHRLPMLFTNAILQTYSVSSKVVKIVNTVLETELKPGAISALQSYDSTKGSTRFLSKSFRLPHGPSFLSVFLFLLLQHWFVITVPYPRQNKSPWACGKHFQCILYLENWIGLFQHLLLVVHTAEQ